MDLGNVLVTGGAGYIGSHVCIQLLKTGFNVHVLDDFSNSSVQSLKRVQLLSNRNLSFTEGDIRDQDVLREILVEHDINSVIHLAGLKAVGESVEQPARYFDVNVNGAIQLIQAMEAVGVKTLLFSSSATVYGDPDQVPILETAPLRVTNPYGRTKLQIEEMLRDIAQSAPSWRVMSLRYFNPVGAHQTGEIGEDPNGIPNNLFPFIAQVAVGRRSHLSVFGSDYPTSDGTGVRDYIHVLDLADGHLKALMYLLNQDIPSSDIPTALNLGTGQGVSVLEAVRAWALASGRDIPYKLVERRAGDIAECYADSSLAEKLLGWRAEYGINEMCQDHWRWQANNPNGYED